MTDPNFAPSFSAPLFSAPVARNEALWATGLDAYPTSTGDALSAAWERTLRFNPTASLGRWLGRQYPDWPGSSFVDAEGRPIADPQPQPVERLSAEEANARFGLDGQLKFDDGVPLPVAEELAALKREELRQADIAKRSPGGFVQGAGELAVGFAGSAIDPLNIASAFIPVVGQARYAAWAANGVARARFAKGAIEGAVGAVAIEPIVYGVAQAEQADYTALDSFLNVAFGTALGGGLHVGAGWLGDRFGGRAIEERELQLRGAVADLVDKGAVTPQTAKALAARLGAAYDSVRAEPNGDPREVLAALDASEMGELLVKRGAFENVNALEFSRQGYGLVKVIWSHGEKSGERPAYRVARDDVTDLARVVQAFEPIPEPGGATGKSATWVVERADPETGALRKIVYGTTRFAGPDGTMETGRTLVTIYVEDGRRGSKPLSRPKSELPQSNLAAGAGDVAIPKGLLQSDTGPALPRATDGAASPAAQLVANAEVAAKPAPVTPYVAVPKSGQRLAAFVRSWGGIKNEGQEVAALMGRVNGRPGLIDNANGMSIDDMARHAWEAGYFQSRADRPTVAEFLDLLDRDLNGKAVYRADDVSGFDRDAAIQINDEIDRLSAEFDVPVEGKTYAEFFDAVGERMTLEEATARAAALADDIAADYARLDAERQAFLETRWDTWLPDIWGEPRDLGAMERDYAAEFEKTAGSEQGFDRRAARAGGTGSAFEPARGLREDPQPGADGARAAGDRPQQIDARQIDAELDDPTLDLADADLASAVARSQADLDALIAAGLVRADDPEILMAADLAARAEADARGRDAAAFCSGRNA